MDRPTVGSVQILRGNALALALADESVDLIVTSPPYFGLRSYQDGGEHYAGQIGDEPTPAEFVDALIAATAEMVRVLKPSGSIWVNLGDKYASTKSLIGIPWRYALRCIDDLGLILRAEVIWCLSGGAKVYARTPSGDRPIMLRDLVRSYQPENVKLWNGERWTQVLGWNKTSDDDGALELELRTGERIGCTPGHRWPTQRGVIRADELRVGDVIATTTLPEPDEPTSPAFLPDGDIGWLVGLYVAEGSRSGTTVQIAGHVNETERHARLARIAKALDGTSHVYQTSEGGATCNLSGSVILAVIDRYVSQGTAHTKRLRKAAWQRGNGFLQAIVEGYISGDGHHDKANGRWRLGFCANDEWASDLRTLAARLGAKLSLRRAQHVGQFGTFPGWRGEWRWMRSAHHNAKQDGEVVAIRGSRARDFYDLGVEDEPHLFALASGVLTHNSKPNGLPESVTDRVRRSHEQWFHFTREPRYFSAVDEIREAHQHPHIAHTGPRVGRGEVDGNAQHLRMGLSPLGKLPGSVWTIPTEPLHVPESLGIDHFAAFPTEWPRRIIQGWSPSGVCADCGFLLGSTYDSGMLGVRRELRASRAQREGRGSVLLEGVLESAHLAESQVDEVPALDDSGLRGGLEAGSPDGAEVGLPHGAPTGHGRASRQDAGAERGRASQERHQDGQPDRESGTPGEDRARPAAQAGTEALRLPSLRRHDPDVRDALACPHCGGTSLNRPVVADVFGGTGTTALVAKALGRHGISNDMSADYCRLAGWRTTDPKQLAKAARRPFVPPAEQTEGQLDLLEGIA